MRARSWTMAAALLLGAACGRSERPAVPTAVPAPTADVAPGTAAAPEEGAGTPAAPAAAADTAEPQAAATYAPVRVGMTREAFVQATGDCMQRMELVAARSPDERTVEVFQPTGGDCQKRYGQQRYFLLGGQLHSIEPGLWPTGPQPRLTDALRPGPDAPRGIFVPGIRGQ